METTDRHMTVTDMMKDGKVWLTVTNYPSIPTMRPGLYAEEVTGSSKETAVREMKAMAEVMDTGTNHRINTNKFTDFVIPGWHEKDHLRLRLHDNPNVF
jgi:hypothetical protein